MKLDGVEKLISKNKIPLILFICAAIGLILLIGSGQDTSDDGTSSYAKTAEADIERIAEKISGCPVTVIVTLECGYTDEYARAEGGEYATVNGKPISMGKIEPRLRGVTVVCKNGNRSDIQMKITSAICCAYGIGQSRVYVCEQNN